MRNRTRSTLLTLLAVPAWLALNACGDVGGSYYGGPGGGATPGGAQDVGYARSVIAAGGVPRTSDFSVEGLYAEHDLPLPGAAPCGRTLCVAGAGAAARFVDDGASDALLQIGFASSVDPATFKRAPLNLALVVDVSGSMGEALPEGASGAGRGSKIDLVREALKRIAGRLGAADRLAIVLFDSQAYLIRASAPVTDVAAVKSLLDREVYTRGSTNIEEGLRVGYTQARKSAGTAGVTDRVMLFTDAQPNVGATSAASFRGIIGAGAEDKIGLSAFGVGLDFGAELAYAISHLRGGNYFYLSDTDRLRQVIDDEFDFLVTPLAFDMRVRVTPSAGLTLRATYGLPADTVKDSGLTLEVPSVFLSRRRGGIALRLRSAAALVGPTTFAGATLHYATPEGAGVDDAVSISGPGDGVGAMATVDPPGLERIAALTNMYLAMRAASEAASGGGDRGAAVRALDESMAQLRRTSMSQADASLAGEADLLAKLRDNLQRL